MLIKYATQSGFDKNAFWAGIGKGLMSAAQKAGGSKYLSPNMHKVKKALDSPDHLRRIGGQVQKMNATPAANAQSSVFKAPKPKYGVQDSYGNITWGDGSAKHKAQAYKDGTKFNKFMGGMYRHKNKIIGGTVAAAAIGGGVMARNKMKQEQQRQQQQQARQNLHNRNLPQNNAARYGVNNGM
ncbi:MAG: hypothetical protein ACR2MS_07875 [Weeksellaceae bacterium]